jgi:large subunit ribosomal protein L19e
MKLENKKELASKTLNVGKGRVIFVNERLQEIKEAISKQDMRELHKEGAILIKEVKGRKKNISRRNKRGIGKIKKKINLRKSMYVTITRKLRGYIKELQTQKKLTKEEFVEIRKKIRNNEFKSKANLKNYIRGIKVQ